MIFNISNFIELEQGPCNFYILNRNLIFFYHNFLGKLRYRKGGSKIFHSHEKYDGLLVLVWQKKCKKVEAYFTVIYKNTNHLYSGIHDKNSEILNIHYNTKIFHMQKKSVDIILCFWRFFAKKVEKKNTVFWQKNVLYYRANSNVGIELHENPLWWRWGVFTFDVFLVSKISFIRYTFLMSVAIKG